VLPDEIITATLAGWSRSARAVPSGRAAAPAGALEDMDESACGGSSDQPRAAADAVVLGDLGERWTFGLLQEAFEQLMAGAALIALSRDRYFRQGERLALDAGPFVAALEYAAGASAEVAGKPSAAFFAAVRSLETAGRQARW
jgi:ribonucleotide monophosphatase NagD (HAD superfamily)